CGTALRPRAPAVAVIVGFAVRRCGVDVQFPRYQHGAALDQWKNSAPALPFFDGRGPRLAPRLASSRRTPHIRRDALQGGGVGAAAALAPPRGRCCQETLRERSPRTAARMAALGGRSPLPDSQNAERRLRPV